MANCGRRRCPVDDRVHAALHPGVRLLTVSPEIGIGSTRLPGAPQGDPADRILMASARHLGGQLATCDREILDYSGGGQLRVVGCTPWTGEHELMYRVAPAPR